MNRRGLSRAEICKLGWFDELMDRQHWRKLCNLRKFCVVVVDGKNHMQVAADPFEGVPAKALAEFPMVWIERVREGKFWFAG
jgi:hypothetical protein